ncbi:tetratricopeptide repeat protein [Haliscomenobacter hydrossis]|uniref:Tetratricopeptide TPR_2 repeat-containing protein n=1 Tax=Haliscomenobacter hydrossis (strain ATCC 27775 / DSM 1100 / LMG 10767 / O) TaxID=760192 RepID=F4KRY0_HALH1|nr:tetratricopeptide repeat protein [Haliscomenobacter hydrossis]AEE51067.1 Tetratricopeptide TPR_2 repeat-containing protein [Haliscomenobacter hydrossis DSM 1100]
MSKPKKKPVAQRPSSGVKPTKAASPPRDAMQPVSTPKPMIWLWVALLAAWVFIAYLRALDNQFVDWDDPTYVTENPYLQPANQENLHALLRSVVSLNYHPLTMATLWWNAANSGIESARAYIWFNIIFHIFNTGLVFFFAFLLSKRNVLIALVTALGFGLHPMHVESVAWVSERKDVLYVFFFLLSALAYWKHLEKGKLGLWWALALLAFLLSCLSKAMAVSLVPVLFLLDYWQGRKMLSLGSLLEKIPFIALAVLFGLIALDVQDGGSFYGMFGMVEKNDALADFDVFSPFQRLKFAGYGFMMYIVKLFLPFNLSAFYPYPSLDAVKQGTEGSIYLFGLIFTIAAGAWSLWNARKHKIYLFGFGFYFFTIALVLQVISVGAVVMADRYTYLPYVGLFFMLGYGLDALIRKMPASKYAVWGAILGLNLFFMLRTREQVDIWQNHDTLWTNVIKLYPNAGEPRKIRGHYYGKTGRIDLAIADFEAALQNNFQNVSIYEGLGNAYGTQGQIDKAVEMFNQALKLDSTNVSVRYNRSIAQLSKNPQAAIEDLTFVIKNSLLEKAANYGARGYAYLLTGNYAAAKQDYDKAISLDAQDSYHFFNRGQAKQLSGDNAGAIVDYEAALKLKPGMAEAVEKLKGLGR